jgi:MOSC domain-containing protein YiiM
MLVILQKCILKRYTYNINFNRDFNMAKVIGIATHSVSRGEITTHQQVSITTEAGLQNDYQGQKHRQTQVTLLSKKSWDQSCADLGIILDWTLRRANLLIDDIEFNTAMIGQQIQIGGVLLEITQETDPCQRMEEVYAGLKTALTPEWRGGARCMVLRPGVIKTGDSVHLLKRL